MSDPERLSAKARQQISSPANEVYVSAASLWELGLKVAKGKLVLPSGFDEALWSGGFLELPVRASHVEASVSLPGLHADPFDRMLLGQAIEEGLILMTRDRQIHRYQAPLIDC